MTWSIGKAKRRRQAYLVGLNEGDEPRLIPVLRVDQDYKYVGYWTRLDGKHLLRAWPELRRRLGAAASHATSVSTSRGTAMAAASAGVLGNCYYYGAVFGASLERVEAELGPAARSVAGASKLGRRRRQRSAPRVQLHAVAKPRELDSAKLVNDAMGSRVLAAAGRAAAVTGCGLPHPYPAMMAASVTTFMAALATPYETPAWAAAHHGVARVLWELGCREQPFAFDLRPWMGSLDQADIIERNVWAIGRMHGGRLNLREHVRISSPLHASRWPGYPGDWLPLWRGRLLAVTGCVPDRRLLARAGICELANVCVKDGASFATAEELARACPQVLWHHAVKALAALRRLVAALNEAGVTPVSGREPWSAVDARDGRKPSYAPAGYGDSAVAAKLEEVRARASGDGLAAFAGQVGVTEREEWAEPEQVVSQQLLRRVHGLESREVQQGVARRDPSQPRVDEGSRPAASGSQQRPSKRRRGGESGGVESANTGPAAGSVDRATSVQVDDGAGVFDLVSHPWEYAQSRGQQGARQAPHQPTASEVPSGDDDDDLEVAFGASSARDESSGSEDEVEGPRWSGFESRPTAELVCHHAREAGWVPQFVHDDTTGHVRVYVNSEQGGFVADFDDAGPVDEPEITVNFDLLWRARGEARRAAMAEERWARAAAALTSARSYLRVVSERVEVLRRLGALAEASSAEEARAEIEQRLGDWRAEHARDRARELRESTDATVSKLRDAKRQEAVVAGLATGAKSVNDARRQAAVDSLGASGGQPADSPMQAEAVGSAAERTVSEERRGCTDLCTPARVSRPGVPTVCMLCPGEPPLILEPSDCAGLECDGGCRREMPASELRYVCPAGVHDVDVCTACANRGEASGSAQGQRVALLQEAARRGRGVASVRELTSVRVPGRNSLEVDGMARRAIWYYDKDVTVEDREWSERVQGGFHTTFEGKGVEWLRRATAEWRVEAAPGSPTAILGLVFVEPASGGEPPSAWLFIRALVELARDEEVRAKVDAKETQFLLERLLLAESSYPVTHWSASDGSRALVSTDGGAPETLVARAAALFDVATGKVRVFQAGMAPLRDAFEQHSYETELAAYHDLLDTLHDAVVVNVTDCLSGMQAGHAWRTRTDAAKSGRYRDDVLGNVEWLERRQRAVLLVYVHSHVGVAPNEVADGLADAKQALAVSEPCYTDREHALVTMWGAKRDVGTVVFDFFTAVATAHLYESLVFTIAPIPTTWKHVRDRALRRSCLRGAESECLDDACANKLGLLADRYVGDWVDLESCSEAERLHADEVSPEPGGWEWACWHSIPCPCCVSVDAAGVGSEGLERRGAPLQTRWHMLTGCSLAQLAAE